MSSSAAAAFVNGGIILNIKLIHKLDNGIVLEGYGAKISITCAGPGRMRMRLTQQTDFESVDNLILVDNAQIDGPGCVECDESIRLIGEGISAEVDLAPFAVKFYTGSRLVLATVPGEVFFCDAGKTTLRFNLPKGEAVYGLGQGTYHKLNLRDKERRMWNQYDANRYSGNAGIPFMYNTNRYGVLLNSGWASRFAIGRAENLPGNENVVKPAAPWTLFESNPETDPDSWAILTEGGDVDIFVITGAEPLDVLRGYYQLTGFPPMLPKWALGWMQCKNRYKNQKQLLQVARRYRELGIPMDVLIIDWNWFKYFGFLQWVSEDWPDPVGMFRELKSMGIHVLAAIHPYMHEESPHFHKFADAGALIEWDCSDSPYWPPVGIHHAMDFTNPQGRKLLWQCIKPLLDQGLAGFWTDMGELEVQPENSTEMYLGSRIQAHNLYCNGWAKAIYEGQRADSNQRVFTLARTSYAGTQRFSTAMWTGDVDCDFEVFRDQVLIGQQLAVSGQPYTCTDIGGFISMPYYDPELYVRWQQWGVFCPLFRTHGTRPDNEPWVYGARNQEIITAHIELRYRLMPYIYSLSYMTHSIGRPIVLPMALAFPEDDEAARWEYQFMFGPSLLVSPVVERGAERKTTYLPQGEWLDFYTGERYTGGCTIVSSAPQSLIPVYVWAGAIVPMSKRCCSVQCMDAANLEIHVYPGADGQFVLYEDDGETYDYENGASMHTLLEWNDAIGLTIHGARGNYHGSPELRDVELVIHGQKHAHEVTVNGRMTNAEYDADSSSYRVNMGELHVRAGAVAVIGAPLEYADVMPVPKLDYAVEFNAEQPQRVLKLYLHNPYKYVLKAHVHLIEPLGYRIGRSEFDEYVQPGDTVLRIDLTMTGAQSASAELRGSISVGDVKLELNERLNSGWATWWSVVLGYPFDGPEGLNVPLPPESVETFDDVTDAIVGTVNDSQCFGYTNLRKAMYATIPFEKLQGMRANYQIGFAACHVDLVDDTICYAELMGDDRFRVWIDGVECMRVEDHYEAPQRSKLTLTRGRHRIVVKAAQDARLEWNDRAWGFYFRLADSSGQPIENALYSID